MKMSQKTSRSSTVIKENVSQCPMRNIGMYLLDNANENLPGRRKNMQIYILRL